MSKQLLKETAEAAQTLVEKMLPHWTSREHDIHAALGKDCFLTGETVVKDSHNSVHVVITVGASKAYEEWLEKMKEKAASANKHKDWTILAGLISNER